MTESDRAQPPGLRVVGLGEPQMLADDHLIENRFDANMSSANVPHVYHAPHRRTEPVIVADKPWEQGFGLLYPGALYDPNVDRTRIYYTLNKTDPGPANYPVGRYFVALAESVDGFAFEKPEFGLHGWGDMTQTNIVMTGDNEAHTAHVHVAGGASTNPGTLPARFLKQHRYAMYFGDFGSWIATSEDGVHWHKDQQVIKNRIDCYQTMSYDESQDELVSYVRNKLIFGSPRKFPEDHWGNTRAISHLSAPDWWRTWDQMPTSVLLPDAGDGHRFYGLPCFRYGGVSWGFLHHLYEDPQTMDVELVFSRDGHDWKRAPREERLLPLGDDGCWDGGMILSSDRVVEAGDEWRIYYSGHPSPHDTPDQLGSIGVAILRKEGFVSVRARTLDSYVLTRPLSWPGGHLAINAVAKGSLQVRVTDLQRATIDGFAFDDCVPFTGDSLRHKIRWREKVLSSLAGLQIQLEFKFRQADLFSFVAQALAEHREGPA